MQMIAFIANSKYTSRPSWLEEIAELMTALHLLHTGNLQQGSRIACITLTRSSETRTSHCNAVRMGERLQGTGASAWARSHDIDMQLPPATPAYAIILCDES
jgi:hypothetical protein